MRIKIIPVIVVAILFAIGFFVSATFLTIKQTVNEVIVTAKPGPQQTTSPTPDPNAPFGVLLMGLRGDDSRGAYLTDTMILGIVKPKEKAINLISIPRDLWVPIPVTQARIEHSKINAAYAIGIDDRNYTGKEARFTGAAGGGTLAKHIVEEVFGIPVRYFISLDFDGFKKSIDVLGGVSVPVSRSFEDPYYPITGEENNTCGKSDDEVKALTATLSGDLLEHNFPCRYEILKFDKGVIQMDGETALKYARSRHSLTDGTDFARSSRQKEIMLAVKDKILQIGFVTKAIPFIQSLAGDLRTDISLEAMTMYATQINEYKNFAVTSTSLSTDNALVQTYSEDGQYILIPKSGMDNWASIRQLVGSTPLEKQN